ncbi:thiamine diphosphate-binding protein [Phakopsora pachyrhizi]|nr:thiamine diphosphate-binding protein [Phakopsora pachyrhizi]
MYRLNLQKLPAGYRAIRSSIFLARSTTRSAVAGSNALLNNRPLATHSSADDALRKAPSPSDAFVNSNNSYYIEEMYRLWKKDQSSVHQSWNIYFSGLDKGLPSERAFQPPPGLVSMPNPAGDVGLIALSGSGGQLEEHMKIQLLVRAYQVRGHYLASLDPLNLVDRLKNKPPELDLKHYGFDENTDYDKEFSLGPGILPLFQTQGREKMKLREIIEACERIYCKHIGLQYVHLPDRTECDWIRQRVELPVPWSYSLEEKRMILDRLIWSDSFERFVASKHPNEKRFGLEGGESLIPGMKALIDRSVDAGVKSIVIGMPHRGRLNVLSNVIRKPMEAIFNEFAGSADASEDGGGDVKYHLGANYVRPTPSGKKVALSLVANPSHLEAEDPVVLGKTKALQHFDGHGSTDHAMGILLHGDAAFAGQGVVYETMGFHDLPNFGTGGTVHLVINNQIGFTTDPNQGRSTPYPSDIAKSIDAPIFHVNGDDAEAVTFVCQLAADWRAAFKKDVVIDIVCYRRHGHNETDQPSFTQPKMYKAIAQQPATLKIYSDHLVKEGSFTEAEIEKHKEWVWGMMEKAYEGSKDYHPTSREWLSSSWDGFPSPKELKENILDARPTGVEESRLRKIGETISQWPKNFEVHKNLSRILKNRGKTIADGEQIDWSTAEALAFGSLLMEGNHVRVSGQDVERGTFSQRHAVLHDQNTNDSYIPLSNLPRDGDNQVAPFTICNSSLSEFGALGFELGYSLVDPHLLTMWEAQFGDFANNAQCIIDQFICSGERKWLQRTGLVMSLPHGYDGQGPEHSSARIERFLQLCDDHPFKFPSAEGSQRIHQDCNMQLVYCTTPSNYFHVLRRQIHRDFRKPLIIFFSKSLLRHPLAKSPLKDMSPGAFFVPLIQEPGFEGMVQNREVRRHIFCSGQVYYTLLQEREKRQIKDIAISRLEQLSPVPYNDIVSAIETYPNAEVMYCQEEPINGGAFTYLAPRFETAMNQTSSHGGQKILYAGRPPYASVATGSKKVHQQEIEVCKIK